MLLFLAATAPLSAQAGDDVMSNLEWDVYVREYNDEVQKRQQQLDARGYTPSRPDGAGPETVTWLVVPSMGFQWNREGGAGEDRAAAGEGDGRAVEGGDNASGLGKDKGRRGVIPGPELSLEEQH